MLSYNNSQIIPSVNRSSRDIEERIASFEEGMETFSILIDYYMNKKGWPRIWKDATRECMIVSAYLSIYAYITTSAAFPYIDPTLKYVDGHFGDSIFMKASFLAGTCTPAVLVFNNAAEIYLEMLSARHIPKDLKHLLQSANTSAQQRIENAIVVIGSALSAIPIAVVAFMYPLPNLSTFLAYVVATNTIIINAGTHLLPVQLLVHDYGNLLNRTKKRFLTPEQQAAALKAEKVAAIYQGLKDRLVSRLTAAQKRMVKEGFTWSHAQIKYQVDHNYLPDTVIAATKKTAVSMVALCEYGAGFVSANLAKSNSWIPSIISGVGATLVTAGCSGYLAETYNVFANVVGSEIGGAVISALPIIVLTRLLVFFGSSAATDNYNYWTSWGRTDIKIPLEFKQYPKTTAVLMLFGLYLSAFSYAAAAELIETNFADEKWDFLRPILLGCAKIGVPYVSMNVMMDFYIKTINKFVRYFGKDEGAMILQLNTAIDQFKHGIYLMKNEAFVAALKECDDQILQSIIGLSRAELDKQLEELDEQLEEIKLNTIIEDIELEVLLPTPAAASEPSEQVDENENNRPRSSLFGWFSKFNFSTKTDKPAAEPLISSANPRYGSTPSNT